MRLWTVESGFESLGGNHIYSVFSERFFDTDSLGNIELKGRTIVRPFYHVIFRFSTIFSGIKIWPWFNTSKIKKVVNFKSYIHVTDNMDATHPMQAHQRPENVE